MFPGYTVYKIWHKVEERWYACLYNPGTKQRLSMSWARYTMSCHLNRLLDPNKETVDHINDDKLDDRIENLQLLTRVENSEKSAPGRLMADLICPNCNRKFTRERRQTHLVKGGYQTCCSRYCGRMQQLKRQKGIQ